MSDDRHARIKDLGARARYASSLGPAADDLSALLGVTITKGDAVSREAVAAALEASAAQDQFHFVWHRVWGSRLRPEFIATTARLAAMLEDEAVLVVWGSTPAVGFNVSLARALAVLPSATGPKPLEPGRLTVDGDVLILADAGESGLRFGYHHHARADQYELLSWGRFARSVDT